MFQSISELKAKNRERGSHFFSPSTMRFFHSRIESRLYGGRFFITSEQREYTTPRRFTVREALPSGDIRTVGEFHAYVHIADARAVCRALCKARQS